MNILGRSIWPTEGWSTFYDGLQSWALLLGLSPITLHVFQVKKLMLMIVTLSLNNYGEISQQIRTMN